MMPMSKTKKTLDCLLMGKTKKTLYIRPADVPWLVTYIADECACGGVHVDENESASAVAVANSYVPGLHVEWNFNRDVWDAWFVEGTRKGKSYQSSPTKMSPAKWEALVDKGVVSGVFENQTAEARRDAALMHLQEHCKTLLFEQPPDPEPAQETQ